MRVAKCPGECVATSDGKGPCINNLGAKWRRAYNIKLRPLYTVTIRHYTVWSNTSQSNYRHIQILQSKCLRIVGDYPRRTPIHYLHSTLSLEYIHTFIYRLTEKFFQQCTTHSNPLISQIENYSLPDLLTQYRKYTHKRTKHLLL